MDPRHVGVDNSRGLYAEVTVERCRGCGRHWLEYRIEDEAFTASGRRFRGEIDEDTARGIVPEEAARTIEGLDRYFFGGSYFGHPAKPTSGKMRLR